MIRLLIQQKNKGESTNNFKASIVINRLHKRTTRVVSLDAYEHILICPSWPNTSFCLTCKMET